MIKSSRFSLVKVTEENIHRFHDVTFSIEMMKYITGQALTTKQAIKRYSSGIDHKYFGTYFVESPDGKDVMGIAVIKDKEEEAEIGYMVMKPFAGRGIGTEINQFLIQFCIEKIIDREISAYVDIRNKPSIRVLQKSGMRRVEIFVENGNTVYKYQY